MGHSVARQLVSVVNDAVDDLGKSGRHFASGEKGRRNALFGQQVEQPRHPVLDSAKAAQIRRAVRLDVDRERYEPRLTHGHTSYAIRTSAFVRPPPAKAKFVVRSAPAEKTAAIRLPRALDVHVASRRARRSAGRCSTCTKWKSALCEP